MAQKPEALGVCTAFDLEDLGALESLESRMGEVEGNRDSGNRVRRKPFLGEPAMRLHTQVARGEFVGTAAMWTI